MAVIRQRREVIDKPIGVIRADTSSAQAHESIGNLADTLIETSFNALKREAKQAGTTSAQRQSLEGLRTINPETGLPEAFQALKVMENCPRCISKSNRSKIYRAC